MKRTALRRHPKPNDIDLEAAGRWRDRVTSWPCILCGSCRGIEGHHVIKQQTLVRRAKELRRDKNELLWDLRIGVSLCRVCHSNVTAAMLHIPHAKLPVGVFGFAREYGLLWLLEREYPELAA